MKRGLSILLVTCVAIVGGASSDLRAGAPEQAAPAESSASPHRALLDRYCVTCHNERLKTAGLTLDTMELGPCGHRRRRLGKSDPEASGGLHASTGTASPG